jgi:exopolysaccharide/PEP-CTERM locus tyrosine autokinase
MSRIEDALARAAGMQSGLHSKGNRGGVSGIVRAPMGEPVSIGRARLSEETMVVINEPLSPMAEEYRKLKETLVKMTKRDRFDNLIAVTSSIAGEGKSTASINLAASLAGEYDHTVLLVDADLRRPTVHKYLGLAAGKGLSDCMREGLDMGELLIKTGIGKLSVLPAGTPIPNPVELFSSDAMRDLFREMKTRYGDRYIIIDTPPVLPFAETRSVASIVDGVILVVREGMPSLDQVVESIDALDQKVLGIVYNGAHLQSRSSYYYSE